MAGKKNIVEQALKLIIGTGEKTAPSVLVERGKNTPISAWHATEKPFTSYDWGLLGSTTKPNVEGTGVENWAMDLARVGPWSSEKKIDLGFGTHIPVTVGGKGKAFNSLDDLQRAIAKAGGPDKFRQNMTAKGFGHLRVADEEFGGTSYVSLTPETFTVRDDSIERASGGSIRQGYGSGGWVDDVVKMAGKVISGEGEDAAKAGIRAYHGSPHDFDKFDMSKIGTGEGAQAYGHGLYFAESEPVAKGYRDALSRPLNTGDLGRDLANYAVTQKRGSIDDAVAYLNREMANYDNRPAGWPSPEYKKQYEDALGILTSGNWKPAGRMYEVNIAADPNQFLDWDKPLSEQPKIVQDAFKDIPLARSDYGSYLWHGAVDKKNAEGAIGEHMADPMPAIKTGPKAAMEYLREAGIPGIKYLDAGSRGAGDGTRNYVVFDDKLISIIRKYGIAGASAMLGYNLMEQLDPKQALAASMADQDYQASRPQRSMGGNNSISGALNVARGLNGVK